MNKKLSISLMVFLIFIFLFPLTTLSSEYPCFVSCKEFIELDETEQIYYLVGASDFLDCSMTKAGYEKYYEYTKDYSAYDLLEFFLDYLHKNPKYLSNDGDESAAYIFLKMISMKILPDVLK